MSPESWILFKTHVSQQLFGGLFGGLSYWNMIPSSFQRLSWKIRHQFHISPASGYHLRDDQYQMLQKHFKFLSPHFQNLFALKQIGEIL